VTDGRMDSQKESRLPRLR